jgi:hypothetical protein
MNKFVKRYDCQEKKNPKKNLSQDFTDRVIE